MMFVYTRAAFAGNGGMTATCHSGWLRGTSAGGVPYPPAWISHAVKANDIWRQMAFAAPAPHRHSGAPRNGQQSYILQQDPSGLWYVDPWASNSAGTIRPAATGTASSGASRSTPSPAAAGGSNDSGSGGGSGGGAVRDLADTCFIIELERATPR